MEIIIDREMYGDNANIMHRPLHMNYDVHRALLCEDRRDRKRKTNK